MPLACKADKTGLSLTCEGPCKKGQPEDPHPDPRGGHYNATALGSTRGDTAVNGDEEESEPASGLTGGWSGSQGDKKPGGPPALGLRLAFQGKRPKLRGQL